MVSRKKPGIPWFGPYYFAALIFAGGLLLAGFWIVGYVHSDEFAASLGRSTGHALHSDAVFTPLRWGTAAIKSESLVLKGESASLIEKAEANELNAVLDWRALLSGLWRVEEITVGRLTAEFKAPGSTPVVRDLLPPSVASFLPSRFQLDRIGIKKADITYKNVVARDVGLNLLPGASGWTIDGKGGTLSIPKLPLLQVQSFHCRERKGVLFLYEATFQLPPTGRLSAVGQSGKDANLKVDWSGVPVRSILTNGLDQYIDGTVSGTSSLDADGRAQGAFQVNGASLTNVPLLSEMAKLMRDPTFQKLPLRVVSADFNYRAESLQLSNVILESPDNLRLEGCLAVEPDGRIRGNFEIGVKPPLLETVPGVRDVLFSTVRNGWCWAPLEVGGTLANPTENLSRQLAPLVMGALLLKKGSEVIEKLPSAPVDTVRDVLDLFLSR